jgi:nucleotide-binding universal stress UspA family protein
MVAYDGSAEAHAAVSAAVTLFPGRRLLVITVWERGLAMAMVSASGAAVRAQSGSYTAEVSRVERGETERSAKEGTELARDLGATADAIAITQDTHASTAIVEEADRHDASAIVVGSRGLGRVKAPLLGSTSQALLRDSSRPVLVVKSPS